MARNLYLEELDQQIARTEREIDEMRGGARRLVARGNKSLARQFRARANDLSEDLAARKARRDLELAARPAVAS